MIKKILLVVISVIFLSGCNLAISFFDSTMDDDTEAEPTPEPTEKPEPTAVPDPVVINGGFEEGRIGWDGEFALIGQAPNSGSYCARIATDSYISQHIRGLAPDTEYVLSLYTRFMNLPGEGHVTIQDSRSVDLSGEMFEENTAWNHLEIPFTLTDGSTEVTITIHCDHANVDVDDISLQGPEAD